MEQNRDPFEPGVNAGPNTAFGGKPDESGSVVQQLITTARTFITH